MRRLFLLVSAVSLSFSFSAYAGNFDASTINLIHNKTKSAVIDECKKDLPAGSPTSICDCIGQKAQTNLDDAALKKCPAGPGSDQCLKNIVVNATIKALSKESVQACQSTTQNQAAAPTPTRTADADSSNSDSSNSDSSNSGSNADDSNSSASDNSDSSNAGSSN